MTTRFARAVNPHPPKMPWTTPIHDRLRATDPSFWGLLRPAVVN